MIKEGVNDPDNPTSVKGGQSYYYDKNGKKQLSLINKRAEEGDWGEWADKLPSQFLSKQSRTLIKKQLNLAAADKQSEFDEICSLTNPTVKKALLKSFADDCDAAAVHLQAAALPRQKYQVILPLTSIKDNEVYAPNYKNGVGSGGGRGFGSNTWIGMAHWRRRKVVTGNWYRYRSICRWYCRRIYVWSFQSISANRSRPFCIYDKCAAFH